MISAIRLRHVPPGLALVALLAVLLANVSAALGAVPLPARDNQRLHKGAPDKNGERTAPRTATQVIRPGASGQQVRTLQKKLKSKGVRIAVDGAYGPTTRRAVRAMQRRLGMRPTGIATKAFLKKLGIRSFPSPARAGSSKSPYLVNFPFPRDVRYSYTNSFGAPRSQGGHEGTDILAPKGAPVVSVSYGVVDRAQRVERGLGGIYVWIKDRSGNLYYYAHMDSLANGIEAGAEVYPGRQIGSNGNSGDARFGVHHVHFEIRPGGWSQVTNPYRHLRAVDPRTDSSA